MPPKRQAVTQKATEQHMPEPKSKASPKSKPEPKSKATDGNAKSLAEAKAKEKAKVPKIKNTSMACASLSTAVPTSDSGWLNVEIRNELPKDQPLFTPEQAKQLKDMEVFFRQFKTDTIKPRDDHVLIQCKLQNDMPPEQKVLLDHQMGKVKEIQRWLSSRK